MRTLLPLLLVFFGAMEVHAEERPSSERAFVEVALDNTAPYVGQPFVVQLRLGVDKAWFEARAVPLFRQSMDVPVQVEAAWLRSLSGTRDPLLSAGATGGLSFALNDDVVRAGTLPEVNRAGRTFVVLEQRRVFEATKSGVLVLEAPTLRFAYATTFEEDFVGGRVAIDRQDQVVRGKSVSVRVRALPEAGRPVDFDGAVGRFEVQARMDEDRFETDGVLRLHLDVRGEGNLWTFPRPRLVGRVGIHIYGATESRRPDTRTITYELVPTSPQVTEFPAIALPFFDPTPPGTYRRVETKPLPLSVRLPGTAGGTGDSASDTSLPGATPPGASPPGTASGEGWPWRRIRICVGLLLVALCAGIFVRRRQGAVQAPLPPAMGDTADEDARQERVLAAEATLRRDLGGGGAADALAEYLAAHLDAPVAAIVAPDLDRRLVAAGVAPDLAARTAEILAHHVAARYGAPASDASHALNATLVDALQVALASPD